MKRFLLLTGYMTLSFLVLTVAIFLIGRSEYLKWRTSVEKFVRSRSNGTDTQNLNNLLLEFNSKVFSKLTDPGLSLSIQVEKVLETDSSVTLEFFASKEGFFCPIVLYKQVDETAMNPALEVEINGVTKQVILDNLIYYDFSKTVYDRYGNEIVPEQYNVNGYVHSFMKDSKRISGFPQTFKLNVGRNRLSLRNLRKSIYVKTIYFANSDFLKVSLDHKEYTNTLSGMENKATASRKTKVIIVEAEEIFGKSDFLISISNLQTASVTPYEVLKKKVNVIEENTFKQAGQEVHWRFYVEAPGFYKLGFRYIQSQNQGIPVFRNILIDGKIPFSEFENYPFHYTGFSWKDITLPYAIYLEKGWHVLTLQVTTGMYGETVLLLQTVIARLQEIGLNLRKLVGNNLDPNRTWDIGKYLPGVLANLKDISTTLRHEYDRIIKIVGEKGRPAISDLIVSAELIDSVLKKPERLPFFLDQISEGSSSIAQRLSELSMRLKEQPMGLDKFYLYMGELPKELSNFKSFLITAYEEIQKLFLSFLNKNEAYSIYERTNPTVLRVWVNRPIQYVETLQYLIDTDFTPKTGIRVMLSLMPNEQKLILASASGNVPDVALGISNWIPFELAIRNALFPLSDFDDFFEVVGKDYNLETLLPMVIDDKVYGVVETQNFYVLYYRKDVVEKLGIPIPDTWDDVKKILPELQRRGMNFFIPMCEQTTKYFNTTGPFFFQNGAKLYSKDGLKTLINEENAVKAFELMTELFTVHGMPEQVASFYNAFRYGRIPIGVGDFGLYVLLSNAADELYGLWEIVPSPGVRREDGTVVRYQVASDRADVIFAKSDNVHKAWEFLKWWLSAQTQLKYARLLVNRYGPTYLWNTANINAFKELDFIDERHKKVILEQWKWIREFQRHPGGYMVEREISNIWNKIVVEGRPLRPSIDRSVVLVNRELERKLTEFGYVVAGEKVRDYRMYDTMEEFLKQNRKNLRGDSGGL